MAEYIEREQLIKSIQSVKMVDVVPNCDEPYAKEAVYKQGQAIKKIIEKHPTADVVKVVRCKECEFAKPQALKLNGKELRRCDLHKRPCFLTNFCSYGVLKEGEGE